MNPDGGEPTSTDPKSTIVTFSTMSVLPGSCSTTISCTAMAAPADKARNNAVMDTLGSRNERQVFIAVRIGKCRAAGNVMAGSLLERRNGAHAAKFDAPGKGKVFLDEPLDGFAKRASQE